MAKQQQRQMRVEPKNQMAQLQALENKSDEELVAETRHKAYAQAILGARAAERRDATRARTHFQKALSAARPQERMQIRRMADYSLALAESRADDLKRSAERFGAEVPTGRQLFGLRILGWVAPPKSAGSFARWRGVGFGILLFLAFLAAIWGVPFGILSAINAGTGGISLSNRSFYSIAAAIVIIAVLVFLSRRRSKTVAAKRAEMVAERQAKFR